MSISVGFTTTIPAHKKWRFIMFTAIINKETNRKAKAVICLETGEVFATGRIASKTKGIAPSCISRSCNNGKETNGLNFRFLDENGNPIEPIRTEMEQPMFVLHEETVVPVEGIHVNGNSKAVFNLLTGDMYASVTDAAKGEGVSQSMMSIYCNAPNGNFFFISKADERIEEISNHIKELKSRDKMYDPEYLEYIEWKAEQERKAKLEAALKAKLEAKERLEMELMHLTAEIENYEREVEAK